MYFLFLYFCASRLRVGELDTHSCKTRALNAVAAVCGDVLVLIFSSIYEQVLAQVLATCILILLALQRCTICLQRRCLLRVTHLHVKYGFINAGSTTTENDTSSWIVLFIVI